MASSTDALLALRQAIKSQTPVTYSNASGSTSSLSEATHFTLSPSLSLPKTTPTRLRKAGSTSTDPAASPGDFYTLDAVYVAWLAREAGAGEYMKQARENGLAVGFVSVTERKGIVEWLEGKTDIHASIAPLGGESTTPPGTPPPNRKFLPSTPGAGSSSLTAPQPTGGAKKRYVPDAADKETVKKIKLAEIELRDRNTVLRGTKTNNFAAIQTAFSDKLKKLRDQSKSGTAASTTTAPTPDIKSSSRKGRNVIPIIMISSSPTALITMYNVKQFLQEATFEPSQDARNRAASEGNSRPEDMIAIYRQRTIIDPSGREIQQNSTYYVVDSVEALSKFGADAWERVVCVMTTGQAWQFRPYKWNEPRTLFHHVRGVYVAWSNDPPNPKIKDWNVALLKIDPNRRHVDKSVVAEFWKTLDGWMMANKPWLMQSK